MWLLGNRPDDHESREKAFYKKPINYDTVWKKKKERRAKGCHGPQEKKCFWL